MIRFSRQHRRLLSVLLVGLLALFLAVEATLSDHGARAAIQGPPSPYSSYALAQRAPFNRPDHYPLTVRPDPALYRPHAEWMGRLILPSVDEQRGQAGDWVWLELEQAPQAHSNLIGRRLRLRWQDTPVLNDLVATVTTDIRFGAAAARSTGQGNVVPARLNGRHAVGPLQSLAGARPHDDVTIALDEVELDTPPGGGLPDLRVARAPVQITGRWMGLVRILGPDADTLNPDDHFLVRHYNRDSGSFTGPIERVRIPRQPPDRYGRRLFDPRGLVGNPIGEAGWLLYGSPDAAGVFTVQALEPRRLFQLQADRTITETDAELHYIARQNWHITSQQRGRIRRVALGEQGAWSIGDQAVVIHNFGGIGGVDGEPVRGFTVPGHFAFGQARVIADPFTGEPRFSLRYHQIYANNPNGIVAGSQDWSAYSGDLQRGWLGTRPISDVIIKADPLLAPELAIQAQVLMARYRSGDGTGVSSVTAATSCVQDSSQALWIAIDQLRLRLGRQAVSSGGPDVPLGDTSQQSLAQLASLAHQLDGFLTPFGMVRSDWNRNAELVTAATSGLTNPTNTSLPGTDGARASSFQAGQSLKDVLLSWRSMMPRRAHDGFAELFVRRGTPLWILRTNQLPGGNPRLEPLAPTLLLGQNPVLGTLLQRLTDAIVTPPTGFSLGLSLALLAGYGAVIGPVGWRSGFLRLQLPPGPAIAVLRRLASLLLMPALLEELIFRVALLPHPMEALGHWQLTGWAALSVGLYVLYHPLAARLWYPRGLPLFDSPRFLVPSSLLGVVLTVSYLASGSLWPPVLIHWIVVLTWLEFLGGRRYLGLT